MASERGNNEDGQAYEQQRLAQIESNKRKLAALQLPSMSNVEQQGQKKKRSKRTHKTGVAATEAHNLRPRTQINCAGKNTNEDIGEYFQCETTGDFLSDNNDFGSSPQKKRKGRGITKLPDIFSRAPDMPKIKILVNEYGQPVGENVKRFTRAIGCTVRRKLRVGYSDWRLVDAEKKFEVWTIIKEIYDVSEDAFNWFMTTCGLKWKEFKSTLKKKYFDKTISDTQLKEMYAGRVTDADWVFLSNYWKSPGSERRTLSAKDNRSKLGINHSSGSKSFTCYRNELGKKLGRPPRRDEVFIKTHTRKNGVPLRQAAALIEKLEAIVVEHPELTERTIQEGDVLAAVCGQKEPRGRVRCLGIGPTPQDIGTPGLKCYAPTRLQMEVLARKRAEREVAALQQRLAEREERREDERENVEILSQNGSNSRHHVSPRSEEEVDEDEASDQDDEDECLLMNRRVEDPAVVEHNQESPNSAIPAVQSRPCRPVPAPSSVPRNDTTSSPHDELVGKDVILYAVLRPEQAVAKGTIISTNPCSILAGEPLGKQYCEVVVNVVLKRDTVLPRPYADVETMADAHMMPIAWPYQRLKVTKASQSSQGGRSQR